jgi:hypothetical protein
MGFIQYSMIFGDIPLTLGARAIQLKAADAAQREGKPPTAQTPAAHGKPIAGRAPAPRCARASGSVQGAAATHSSTNMPSTGARSAYH